MAETTPSSAKTDPKKSLADRFERLADAYGVVLLLLIVALLLPVVVTAGRTGRIVAGAVIGAAVVVALSSSRLNHWVSLAAIPLTLVGFVLNGLADDDHQAVGVAGSTVLAVLLFFAAGAILLRIGRHQTIGVRTLYGAIAVYLMIGLGFSFTYQAEEWSNDNAIEGTDIDGGGYVYYSFVTQTTVGYGDITPASEGARTTAIFEMLIGQVYLVVIVAQVVSLLSGQRQMRAMRDDPTFAIRIRDGVLAAQEVTDSKGDETET